MESFVIEFCLGGVLVALISIARELDKIRQSINQIQVGGDGVTQVQIYGKEDTK